MKYKVVGRNVLFELRGEFMLDIVVGFKYKIFNMVVFWFYWILEFSGKDR